MHIPREEKNALLLSQAHGDTSKMLVVKDSGTLQHSVLNFGVYTLVYTNNTYKWTREFGKQFTTLKNSIHPYVHVCSHSSR